MWTHNTGPDVILGTNPMGYSTGFPLVLHINFDSWPLLQMCNVAFSIKLVVGADSDAFVWQVSVMHDLLSCNSNLIPPVLVTAGIFTGAMCWSKQPSRRKAASFWTEQPTLWKPKGCWSASLTTPSPDWKSVRRCNTPTHPSVHILCTKYLPLWKPWAVITSMCFVSSRWPDGVLWYLKGWGAVHGTGGLPVWDLQIDETGEWVSACMRQCQIQKRPMCHLTQFLCAVEASQRAV